MIITKVTGTTFGRRQETIRELYNNGMLEKDCLIELIKEPDCKFDKNARRCEVAGNVIGYVDKEIAEFLSIMEERNVNYIGVVEWAGSFHENIGIRMILKRLG